VSMHAIGALPSTPIVDIQLRTVGPGFVDEQHWQRSLPLVVQAGALDAVGLVLLCQGERCGDESRIAPRFSFVSRGYRAAEKPRS
jgi:hypothetical protein